MTALKDDVAKDSNKRTYYIPIACAVFTFIYWFIFTPLLWSAVSPGDESFSAFLLTLGAFWALVVGLLLLVWCFRYRDHKTVKDRVSIVNKNSTSSSRSNSPPFPTKAEKVQPTDSPISYAPQCKLIDNLSTISLNSLPVQPNNTPSLYNTETGRHSYESGYPEGVLMSKKPNSTDVLEKNISSSSSSSSSEHNVDVEDGLKEDMKKYNDEADVQITVAQTHEVPRLSSKDSFQGLPEMNAFDGYLHLTTVDTPLSPPTAEVPDSSGLTPREIFFSDLIRNAEDSERKPGDRRSFCIPKEISAADKRKSMPLYLYFTSTPPPYEEVKPLQSVADSEAYSLSSLSQKVTNEELQSNLQRFDSEQPDPVQLERLESEHLDVEGERRHSSAGEYFIANVMRQKSMTSEVRLQIAGDPEPQAKQSTSGMHWRVVGDTPDTLCVDNEGYTSDDNVFEDDMKTK